jgi:hypothetical protein
MGEKEFVLYPVPAVIIAAGKLTLDLDKFPKAHTAFPAPVTIECYHSLDGRLA